MSRAMRKQRRDLAQTNGKSVDRRSAIRRPSEPFDAREGQHQRAHRSTEHTI